MTKNGHVSNIEQASIDNNDFRRVLYTTERSQLVLMSLQPGEDIGAEVHDVDQFLRIERGTGKAILNGIEHPVEDGTSIVVPEGTEHNVINTGSEPMKLYSIYMPPHHKDGTVHHAKVDAEGDDEHFDGMTTE